MGVLGSLGFWFVCLFVFGLFVWLLGFCYRTRVNMYFYFPLLFFNTKMKQKAKEMAQWIECHVKLSLASPQPI